MDIVHRTSATAHPDDTTPVVIRPPMRLPTPLEAEHSRSAYARRLAASLEAGGRDKLAARLRLCGMEVRSMTCSRDPGHYHGIAVPHRCRVRICPSCSRAAARVAAAQMIEVVRRLDATDNRDAWVLLTLTAPNVPLHDLREGIGAMLSAWTRLQRRAAFKRGVKGWARRLEVTYNASRDDYHPHIHAMLHVRPAYWAAYYIRHDAWISMWTDALGVDYAPVVDVRRISSMRGSVEAAGKYAIKPLSLAAIADDPRAVVAVADALHKRRLLDFGGSVAQARRELRQADPEAVEDTRPTDCPVCGSPIETAIMHWTEDAYIRYATLDTPT